MSLHEIKQKYFSLGLLGVIFFFFLFVRLYRFSEVVNFSSDQALFSLKTVEIWEHKEITLIGPTFSVNVDGRYAFQGPAIYYFHLMFMLLGQWDPLWSSLFFVIYAGLMIFPLFLGTKWLVNTKAAYLMVLVYSFLPVLMEYTRFLWNPNFQLSLLPILILLMGKFKITQQKKWFIAVAIMVGFLLQFHYQFLFVMFGIFIYYFLFQKLTAKYLVLFLIGITIGFSPLLLFELRHQFYNAQTVLIFLKTLAQAKSVGATGVHFQVHYVLTVFFMSLLALTSLMKAKLNDRVIWLCGAILITWSLIMTVHQPSHAFGMPAHWNLLKEQRAAAIIEGQHLENFRVINLVYDTKAAVQTYLLIKNGVKQEYEDYINEDYLFVVSDEAELGRTQAYEFTTFSPKELKQTWTLDTQGHNLYLFQRSMNR
jgi:hypothetical protein